MRDQKLVSVIMAIYGGNWHERVEDKENTKIKDEICSVKKGNKNCLYFRINSSIFYDQFSIQKNRITHGQFLANEKEIV